MPRTILYISSHAEMGGAQHSLLDIVRNVDTSKFQPLIVVNSRGELYQRLTQTGLATIAIPFETPIPFSKLLNPYLWLINLAALVRLSRLVKQHRVALIHCNDGASLAFIALAKMLHRVPVIFHVRWFEQGIRRRLVHLCAAFWSDKLIANSNAVRTYLLKTMRWVNPDISVVYNAVDTQTFHPSLPKNTLREELHVPNDQLMIGMVGRFVGWKKHELIIKAALRLREEGIRAFFCLIGTTQFSQYTPDAENLKEFITGFIRREKLDGQVRLLGYRNDIERVMAGLDMLVCPSENEPFGRVVIEAMACGVPVIATNSGGIPEIISHGNDGFLFPVNDERALTAFIKQLLTDKQLYRRIASAGRKTVEARFSLRSLIEGIEQVYNEILTHEDRNGR